MWAEFLTRPGTASAPRPWPLELDVELAPSAAGVSSGRTGALADRLADVHGIDGVSVEPHCGGHFVLVRLAVAALDLSDAAERACALVHGCAADLGIGHVVIVAARCARERG